MMLQFLKRHGLLIMLLGLIYTPLFSNLDTLPLRIWDESRLANNAYEMFHNGEYIVTHADGKPDMWNTKPPMMIWLQVCTMKLIGINELAVRLPSAMAALFCALFLFYFSKKYLLNGHIGFFAALVLITSGGFIGEHAARTGDYDALLTLFATLGALTYFLYLEIENRSLLLWAALFFAFAVLTKSVSGMLFFPGLFIYTIWKKKLKKLLYDRTLYKAMALFLVLILAYYVTREIKNPGYLLSVMNNELGGRYMKVIENHQYPFWYYFQNLRDERFSYWLILVPFGILMGWMIKDKRIKNFTQFITTLVITYFLIISTAKTKLFWYDVPLYPFLSILASIAIYVVFEYLKQKRILYKIWTKYTIPYLFVFLLMTPAYTAIVDKSYKPKDTPNDKRFYGLSYFLQSVFEGKRNIEPVIIPHINYYGHLVLYSNVLNNRGYDIRFKKAQELNKGDLIMISDNTTKVYLKENFKLQKLDSVLYAVKYVVEERK